MRIARQTGGTYLYSSLGPDISLSSIRCQVRYSSLGLSQTVLRRQAYRKEKADDTVKATQASPRQPEERQDHYDTASYIEYAKRTGLDKSSTVFQGTHYEYSVAAGLERFGFDLERNGGSNDYGIDLLGKWTVPSAIEPLRVILQCKSRTSGGRSTIGPSKIRELEGTFVGAPPGWRGAGIIALLAAQQPSTKGIRASLARSSWPMGYIYCSDNGDIQQMIWNASAENTGLIGMGIGTEFMSCSSMEASKQRLRLLWNGKPF